jgi:small GTP-binding protein
MGNALFGSREVRLLVAGLDAAGKTTVLYKLRNGPKRAGNTVNTIPTLNFNVETCRFKKIKFSIWDVGGQDSIRPLWRHYFTGTQGLIYVVDSADRGRIQKAAEELHAVVSNYEMRHACVLIFANKTDLPHSLSPDELEKEMRLGLWADRPWHIQPSCATTGEGLWEGLQWMAANVKDL